MKPLNAVSKCRNILKNSGSSFALAFRMLPLEQRDALTAFYAFCRVVDDAVDEAPNVDTAFSALDKWKTNLDTLDHIENGDPVCQALAWANERFNIPHKHLNLILDGVRQDLEVSRFSDFKALYNYCYRVASAVGFVCLAILEETSADVQLYAELCGIAVQLTNILRDVGEDAGLGRIYIPLEDLRAYNVTEQNLLDGRMTKAIKRLLRFQAERARHFYDMAEAALPPESKYRLFFTEALRKTYLALLDRLVDNDFPVFSTKVKIGKVEKIAIALKHRIHPATFVRTGR